MTAIENINIEISVNAWNNMPKYLLEGVNPNDVFHCALDASDLAERMAHLPGDGRVSEILDALRDEVNVQYDVAKRQLYVDIGTTTPVMVAHKRLAVARFALDGLLKINGV